MSDAKSLLSQLLADQRQRWSKGERVLAEEYRRRHPAAFADDERFLDLIYNEIYLREKTGEVPRLDEYLARFPALAESLRLQFDVHQAIESDTVEPRPKIPGYQLLAELGRGGMGVVYKARDERRGRYVAVKVVRPELAMKREVRKRFLREARAAAALDHPYIVRVFAAGESPGGLFLVMEWIDGISLETALQRGPWPIADAIQLLTHIADAVHHAHERGVIHRDLKPANVLLSSGAESVGAESGEQRAESNTQNAKGADATSPTVPLSALRSPLSALRSPLSAPKLSAPKVTDFGLAKILGSRSASGVRTTQEGALLGTLAYMPPEQMGERSAKPGPWNDVYALGGILFALLTGRPPHEDGAIVAAILRARGNTDAPHVRPLRPDVPDELERICRKCLSPSPDHRYPTAQALAEALRRFAGHPPPGAAPRETGDSPGSLWLVPAAGGAAIHLDKATTTIGRAADADVRLTSREVSRRHCRIVRHAEGMYVEDLGSQHGTRVNGRPASRTVLRDGDRLDVAKEVFQVRQVRP